MTISDIRIHGIKNTRKGFLQSVFADALSAEKQRGYTLKTAMEELQRTTDKLHRFGMMWLSGSGGSPLIDVGKAFFTRRLICTSTKGLMLPTTGL